MFDSHFWKAAVSPAGTVFPSNAATKLTTALTTASIPGSIPLTAVNHAAVHPPSITATVRMKYTAANFLQLNFIDSLLFDKVWYYLLAPYWLLDCLNTNLILSPAVPARTFGFDYISSPRSRLIFHRHRILTEQTPNHR